MRNDLEKKIWLYAILIIVLGLIALFSASYGNARVSQKVFYDQLICSGLGLIGMWYLSRLDYRKFYDLAYVFYAINIILLIWVLAAGRNALGATRWLEIGGVNFQPSEFMKVSLIFALSRYLSNRRPTLSFGFFSRTQVIIKDLIIPFLLTLIPMALIFKQPDLGTALLLFGMFVMIIFVSGLEYRYIFSFLSICAALVPFGWHFLKQYQKDRLLVFLNPNIDPLGAGYTIIQSKIAIGSGQLFGKGWLSGTQSQLNFLPERHTDFIFSVIGEEWGLVGGILLIGLYFLLINCSLTIAGQIKDKFGTFVAVGIVSILSLQVIINLGMVMGLFPIVGITLPFVSYGRSSLVKSVIMIGFLLNLSKKRTIF